MTVDKVMLWTVDLGDLVQDGVHISAFDTPTATPPAKKTFFASSDTDESQETGSDDGDNDNMESLAPANLEDVFECASAQGSRLECKTAAELSDLVVREALQAAGVVLGSDDDGSDGGRTERCISVVCNSSVCDYFLHLLQKHLSDEVC